MNIEKIYKENYEKHLNLSRRILKYKSSEAEDVVQEAYRKALSYSDSFDPKKSEGLSWINSIIFNEIRNCLKKDVFYQMEDEEYEDFIPLYKSEEYLNVLNEEILNVKNHLHRQILYCYYIVGYSTKDISDLLGVTITNTTTICNRFKDNIKYKYNVEF